MHYHENILHVLEDLKVLVRQARLDDAREYHLLYGIAYIETQVENQTQDMAANMEARSN